jgi:HD superfamily phosphodiesterase
LKERYRIMNRVSIVKQYVDGIIEKIPSTEERKSAYVHTYGVSQFCSLLASKRGLDPELAYISGLLHDIYAYFTGSGMYHAYSGADMARVAIRKMNIFSDDERIIIISAIFHHSQKKMVHDEYDEVLKDADILSLFFNDPEFRVFCRDAQRLDKLLKELDITVKPTEFGHEFAASPGGVFKRSLLAGVAEDLASKYIRGERDSELFLDIIRYYPEESAFDELKNGWCAAFVYHCALKAGLELPIKLPPCKYRFAGVGAWYEWGMGNGLCFDEKDGIAPERGDIVIYNNIISPENKPANGAWHDHMGIVLSCGDDKLTVAEGNIDNKNVSGVIKRKRNHTIGCYIRIPDCFECDDWNGDYKKYLRDMADTDSGCGLICSVKPKLRD